MQQIKHLLFIVDINQDQTQSLEQAIILCQANKAKLSLVNIVDQFEKSHQQLKSYLEIEDLQDYLRSKRMQQLDPLVNQAKAGQISPNVEIIFGKSTVEIIRFVIQHHVDFIIKNTGSENTQLHFTSQDIHLIRKAPCPVMLYSPNTSLPIKNILVAVDPSDDDALGQSLNANLLSTAHQLSHIFQSKLDIIHTWELAEENDLRHGLLQIPSEEVDTILKNLAEERQHQVEALVKQHNPNTQKTNIYLIKGEPSTTIKSFVEQHQIDLLILGTVGRSGLSGFFLGNTAENIIRAVNCSILTIKPDFMNLASD